MLVTESAAREDVDRILGDGSVKIHFSEPFDRDSEITRVVVATLVQNAMLPDGTVWVAVRGGWVTLKGQVDWDSQRAAAGVLTRCVPGVRGVTNVIDVGRVLNAGIA
jgi:osmotically-inducible protein OsmY